MSRYDEIIIFTQSQKSKLIILQDQCRSQQKELVELRIKLKLKGDVIGDSLRINLCNICFEKVGFIPDLRNKLLL